jgi:effector-binding domain-containing protein
MNAEIILKVFNLDLYGLTAFATNKDYTGTAFRLMDEMWKVVKAEQLKTKGHNIWVYEPGEMVFAGVELMPDQETILEHKKIRLTKYAYYKHVGPYHLIKQAGQKMRSELERNGYNVSLPYIEIYGHWQADESRLETELLMNIL